MEIIKTYVVVGPMAQVFNEQMYQKMHLTKDGRYFLDSGRALYCIDVETATELLHKSS